jgi:hypothetical protein
MAAIGASKIRKTRAIAGSLVHTCSTRYDLQTFIREKLGNRSNFGSLTSFVSSPALLLLTAKRHHDEGDVCL